MAALPLIVERLALAERQHAGDSVFTVIGQAGCRDADVPAKKKAPPKQSQNTSRTSAQKLISPKTYSQERGRVAPRIQFLGPSAPAQLGGRAVVLP
jgi:hypothetical protein